MARERDIRFRDEVSPNVEFLLQSYSNTQDVIQFFDTKVGAYVAVIGLLASLLVAGLIDALIALSAKGATQLKYALMVALGCLALAFLYQLVQMFYQAFQVLSPREGPALMEKEIAVGLFSAGNILEYLEDHTAEEYADAVHNMDERALIAELSYEAIKLSQIAGIKLEHLQKATFHSKWAIMLWAVLLVVVTVIEVILPQIP
ncbi:MAG: hypothetical protein JXA14_26865 [Anaerolineae bacterium]|jgi:hypothetical protein|nr:hypothetical protein [Anaerolineae bacterium]